MSGEWRRRNSRRGATGDTLTLTSVAFNHNSAQSASGTLGGAVFYTGSSLSITGSTFSNNTVSGTGGAQGGAVQVEDVVKGVQVPGSVTITNSTFTGNSANSGNNGNANGGGLYFSGAAGFNGSVTGSTLTGNTASSTASTGAATGGGIDAGGGGTDTFSVSNSRIVGNHVSASSAVASGYYGLNLDGTITNNWWGCNSGPGASGCDTVFFDQSGGGTSTYTPWLVLSVSANPTQVNTSGTSKLTADLTHNSSGTGGFSVPDGTPVTFGGTLDSSVNPTSTSTTSGQATSTYTAGSIPGNGTGTATVDNLQVSTPVDILDSVTVTTNPANLSITVDGVTATAPQTFGWVVGSMHTLNTNSPQAGPSGSQYAWSSWSQGGTQSQTVSAPSSSTTYTANFTTQYQLTTQASPPADGSVTPASGNYYAAGATIPVTATANAGFMFTNWTSTAGTFDSTTSASTNFHMPTAAATVTGNFAVMVVAASTTTSVSSSLNPSFTTAPSNSVTFTATVTSTSTVNEGTVTFTDGVNALTCVGGNPAVVSNGTATCTTSFTTEGIHTITATYSGTVNFLTSHGSIDQEVDSHTKVTGNQYCNQGALTLPITAGAATPYPSKIFVTNAATAVTGVTLTLNNISSSDVQAWDLLLVDPNGKKFVPFANVGDGSSISAINVTLDDAASSQLPSGSLLTSGTFKPSSFAGGNITFAAPAPLGPYQYAAPDGTSTFATEFNGSNPNGTWELFAQTNAAAAGGSIGGGWCVNLPPATPVLTIAKSHTGSFTQGDTGDAYTITVSNSGPGSTSGTLTLTDTLPTGLTAVSMSETGNTGGGTGSDWACTVGTATCTRTTAMPQGESDTITLTVSVGYNTPTGTNAVTNSVSVTGGGASNSPSANDQTTINVGPGYALSTTVNPNGDGTVTPNPTNSPEMSAGHYVPGTVVTLTANPNAGYNFQSWSGSTDLSSTTANPTTITMNSATESVTANFAAGTVQVTVGTSPAGLSFTVDGMSYTSTQTLTWTVGTPHTIATTTPQFPSTGTENGWISWSDGGAISHGVTAPTSNTSYTATFSTSYELSTSANPSNGGTVSDSAGPIHKTGSVRTSKSKVARRGASLNHGGPSVPSSGNYYPAGTVVNLTATPNSGFAFNNWTGNVADSTSASTTITMNSPQSVTANFVATTVQVTVGTSPTGLSFTVDSNTYTSTQTLTWTTGTMHTISTTSPQPGGTGTEYVFTSWSDGGAISHTVTAPSSPTAYTATFGTDYLLTTAANPPAGGSVSPTSGNYYASGAVVPLSATANPSYSFTSWTGGVANANSANTTVTMTGPKSVTANFKVTGAIVNVNPPSVSFGNGYLNGPKLKQVLTVTNTGAATLTFGPATITPGNGTSANDFSFTSYCGTSKLAPGRSCTIAVLFSPHEAGPLSGTLNIYDTAAGSPQEVPLMGTGINPIASFMPTSITFPATKVGHDSMSSVTLKNTGTSDLTISNISIAGKNMGDFTQSSACASTLHPGDTCLIPVTFQPTATGNRVANVTVVDNALSGKQTVALTGKGD